MLRQRQVRQLLLGLADLLLHPGLNEPVQVGILGLLGQPLLLGLRLGEGDRGERQVGAG